MNYADLYAIRAQEAVDTGIVRFNALVDELLADGVAPERINAVLVDDLENGGPIFGKFFRDINQAGDTVVNVAESQGSLAAESVALDKDIASFVEQSELDDQARSGDAEALDGIDILSDELELTWICTMRKTCAKCLPLHGKDMSRSEWRERGLRPRTVHPNCECDWVPSEIAADRDDLIAPLRRQVVPGQAKGGRKSMRAITSADVDAALAARDEALKTPEGRRMLRLLGQSEET